MVIFGVAISLCFLLLHLLLLPYVSCSMCRDGVLKQLIEYVTDPAYLVDDGRGQGPGQGRVCHAGWLVRVGVHVVLLTGRCHTNGRVGLVVVFLSFPSALWVGCESSNCSYELLTLVVISSRNCECYCCFYYYYLYRLCSIAVLCRTTG